jgi:hypothetical protein
MAWWTSTPSARQLARPSDSTPSATSPAARPPRRSGRSSTRPCWPTRSAWTSSGSASTTVPTSRSAHRTSCWPRSRGGPRGSGSAPRSPCSAPTTRSGSSSASPRSTPSPVAAPRSRSAAAPSPSPSPSSGSRSTTTRSSSRRSWSSSPRCCARSPSAGRAPSVRRSRGCRSSRTPSTDWSPGSVWAAPGVDRPRRVVRPAARRRRHRWLARPVRSAGRALPPRALPLRTPDAPGVDAQPRPRRRHRRDRP